MTQKEHDEKVNDLKNSIVEAEKQIQDIRKELDELDKVEIEPESRRWRPERCQTYYYISSNGDIIDDIWAESPYDLLRFAIGNVFKTREEAEFEVETLEVIAELKEFAEPEGREWDSDTCHHYIVYNAFDKKIFITHTIWVKGFNIYFASEEKAQEALEAIGEDRIKKYYFGIKE